MSVTCQNFVQNAWKKDLCSNCFKSKEEHVAKTVLARLVSRTFQNGHAKANHNGGHPEPQSIMRSTSRKKTKRTVCFTSEVSQVIGYGGEEWSEDDTFELSTEPPGEDEFCVDGDEERELMKLTKSNTDYNMLNSNLVPDKKNETRRTFTQLMLGRPQTDAEGKKQTLMVSVTPFGEEDKAPVRKLSRVSHVTVNKPKDSSPPPKGENKENRANGCEKSLLEEISETLEKTTNHSIKLMNIKNTQKDIVLSLSEVKVIDARPAEIKELPLSNSNKENAVKVETEILLTSEKKIELPEKSEGKAKTELTIHLNSTEITSKPVENSSYENVDFAAKPPGESGETKCETREQAGEPDGQADSDSSSEPPALPKSPPPSVDPRQAMDPRPSFLHGIKSAEKPKVPTKPTIVFQPTRKPVVVVVQQPESVSCSSSSASTSSAEEKHDYQDIVEEEPNPTLAKQDSNASDIPRTPNKRRAPKPPSPAAEDICTIYTRNPSLPIKSDAPVVREKEKRERASSGSPKLRPAINGDSTPDLSVPEPAPRRTISLSHDCLSQGPDDKKKARGKFSLKKFLRMGSRDQIAPKLAIRPEDAKDGAAPQPKPRLVIVHPLELNGSGVEVVSQHTYSNVEDSVSSSSEDTVPSKRPARPPPPPRNIQEEWKAENRPARPALPKTSEVLIKQKQSAVLVKPKPSGENVYANLGEVRSSLVPCKPQRTASMREREALLEQKKRLTSFSAATTTTTIVTAAPSPANNYEEVEVKPKDHVYDYINNARSSSPECDSSSPEKNSPKAAVKTRKCDGSGDAPNDFFKFAPSFRSASMQYCGSETESEIYAPYSFTGSEMENAGGEDDSDWSPTHSTRACKLRSRKGRSVVHRNLEDNYGAVVIANHEALAQVVEHIHQGPLFPSQLRGLKTISNLRWSDFSVVDGIPPVVVGKRVFHLALWGAHHVTLALTTDQGSMQSNPLLAGSFALAPITEFNDLVPLNYLPNAAKTEAETAQATIAVLSWMQIDTIQSYGANLKTKNQPASAEDTFRDACFILIQMINGLKNLQAQGVEEVPLSLSSFVLCKDMEKDGQHRLCILQGHGDETIRMTEDDKNVSLCQCTLAAVKELLPSSRLTPLVENLLQQERAISLSQVKSVLEFSLWGPLDVALAVPVKDRELTLQRWLDLERATVLHGLVRSRVQLSVMEEFHLLFLVRSSAKMMCEASQLLESNAAPQSNSVNISVQ